MFDVFVPSQRTTLASGYHEHGVTIWIGHQRIAVPISVARAFADQIHDACDRHLAEVPGDE